MRRRRAVAVDADVPVSVVVVVVVIVEVGTGHQKMLYYNITGVHTHTSPYGSRPRATRENLRDYPLEAYSVGSGIAQ